MLGDAFHTDKFHHSFPNFFRGDLCVTQLISLSKLLLVGKVKEGVLDAFICQNGAKSRDRRNFIL